MSRLIDAEKLEMAFRGRKGIWFNIDEVIDEISDAPSAVRWISVKDRLPEKSGLKVLVAAQSIDLLLPFRTKAVFTAFLGCGDGKWHTEDVGFVENRTLNNYMVNEVWEITHWMHLPETPKEV